MKRKTKLMIGGGLAFAENKDMEKLAEQSRNGWHVLGFKYGFFYEFEQGEPENFIYNIDYTEFTEEEFTEYQAITKESGWEIIQRYGGIVLLRAQEGTPPIYSDQTSFIEREKTSSKQMGKSVLLFSFISLLLLVIRIVMHSVFNIQVWLIFDLMIWMLIGFTIPLFIAYLLIKRKSKAVLN